MPEINMLLDRTGRLIGGVCYSFVSWFRKAASSHDTSTATRKRKSSAASAALHRSRPNANPSATLRRVRFTGIPPQVHNYSSIPHFATNNKDAPEYPLLNLRQVAVAIEC